VSVPPPPARLRDADYAERNVGDILHRVHSRAYGGVEANPCLGDRGRFSPIYDAHGACIPTVYLADTLECALHETLFHDTDPRASFKTVRRGALDGRAHSVLRVARRVRFVRLHRPDLMRWGLDRDDLVSASPKHYAATACWAEAIHRSFPRAQGLVWTSYRCDPDLAYLLFADRFEAGALEIVSRRDAATDPTLLHEIAAAARRAGITITR
jgi:hypothetical protein